MFFQGLGYRVENKATPVGGTVNGSALITVRAVDSLDIVQYISNRLKGEHDICGIGLVLRVQRHPDTSAPVQREVNGERMCGCSTGVGVLPILRRV